MSKIKKAIYISPLLGAAILTLISIIYLILSNVSLHGKDLINFSYGLIKIIPILFFIFTLFSYLISLPIGFLIYREMNKNLKDEKFFTNISLFSGFIISIVIATVNYQMTHILAKSIFIVIGISIMAIANANYFLVLSGNIIIKEKNEKTKGNRL